MAKVEIAVGGDSLRNEDELMLPCLLLSLGKQDLFIRGPYHTLLAGSTAKLCFSERVRLIT